MIQFSLLFDSSLSLSLAMAVVAVSAKHDAVANSAIWRRFVIPKTSRYPSQGRDKYPHRRSALRRAPFEVRLFEVARRSSIPVSELSCRASARGFCQRLKNEHELRPSAL